MANNVAYDIQIMEGAATTLHTESETMEKKLANIVELVKEIKSVWQSDSTAAKLSTVAENMTSRFAELKATANSFATKLDAIVSNYKNVGGETEGTVDTVIKSF